ncbi:MAG TPA: restriction endonuclease subunit S [Ktedonobacteraceae bacterium]|nr:restriction endonuclease subunit S [Ktedonobacteraceae bacterium]
MVTTARETKVKPGYKQTEVGVIPEEWEAKRVGDLVTFSGGAQPPRSTFKFHEKEGYIRLIQIRDYKTDEYETYIPEEFARKKCTVDDIMIGRYGPPIFQILRGIGGAYNVALLKAIPSSQVDKEYLYQFLQQKPLFYHIESLSQRSSGQTGVDIVALKDYPFPLPSFVEQQAIATALSDVDALLIFLDKLIAKKRDIKQAVMQQLLTGKVRLPGFCKKLNLEYKQTEIGMIPHDWEPISLGYISAFITKGATPTTYGFNWVNDGILFLRSECVSEQGLDLSQSMFITPEAHNVLKRSEVRTGDILMTITGNVGRAIYLDRNFGSANINQHVARIRVSNTNVAAAYVFYFLSQPAIRKYYNSITTGQAYPQISLKQVRDTQIFLPPTKAEQQAIAIFLSDMDAEIVALEQRREKTRALKQGMMQELLTGKTRLL